MEPQSLHADEECGLSPVPAAAGEEHDSSSGVGFDDGELPPPPSGLPLPPPPDPPPDRTPSGLHAVQIRTLTGQDLMMEISPCDAVIDVRLQLGECIELSYITNFSLRVHGEDEDLDDATQCQRFLPLKAGGRLDMVFREYEERDVRFHLTHLQDFLLGGLDDVMITHFQMTPAEPPCEQRGYPSLSRILGEKLRSVVVCGAGDYHDALADDSDIDSFTSAQVSLHSVEYALDYTGAHAVGFTSGMEAKLRLSSERRQGQTAPRAVPAMREDDLAAEVDQEALFPLANQAPAVASAIPPTAYIMWSGFNPPAPHRRMQGDIAYIDVTFAGQQQPQQITVTPAGFFLNQSRGRMELNPLPAKKSHFSETLFGTMCSMNPRFKQQCADLMLKRLSLDAFETSAVGVSPSGLRPWMAPPETPGSASTVDAGQRSEGSPSALDQHAPIRDWNEEVHALAQLSRRTPDEYITFQRHAYRLQSEFVDYAARAAVVTSDGQMAPINPDDPPDSWGFSVNSVHVMQASPGPERGDYRLTRKEAKADVKGIHAVREVDCALGTVTSAVVTYKGKTLVCQSILPGPLRTRPGGGPVCKLEYGYDEAKQQLVSSERYHEALAPVAKALGFAEHRVRERDSDTAMTTRVPAPWKGVTAGDGRMYLLDCTRLTPRDGLWSGGGGPRYHRKELLDAFRNRAPCGGFNCDLGAEGAVVCDDPPEVLAEQRKLQEELDNFLAAHAIPDAAAFIAVNPLVDSIGIRNAFHNRGVGMRYLGRVYGLIPEQCAAARRAVELDMVTRVLKTRLMTTMAATLYVDSAAAISAVLNAALGPADEGKKRKKKKKGAGPEVSVNVAAEVLARFRHRLAPGWRERVGPWRLLRAVCLATGLIVRQRVYDFSIEQPTSPDDIRDVQPLLHFRTPRCGSIERIIDKGIMAIHTDAGCKLLNDALSRCYQVSGAVAADSGRCYAALALCCLLRDDVETGILNQRKASVIVRRMFGPDAVLAIPNFTTMGVLAHAAQRDREAIAFLRRALYLSRLVCGFVPAEVAACLAAVYQECGMNEAALPLLRLASQQFSDAAAALAEPPLESAPTAEQRLKRLRKAEALCLQQLAFGVAAVESATEAVRIQKRALNKMAGGSRSGEPDRQRRAAELWYKELVEAAVQASKGMSAKRRSLSHLPCFVTPKILATVYCVPLLADLGKLT
eukprot:TRINITY_DN12001_c0_g1_i1.p1 TRINITY_DN12001_c0_g1~~TRINITY_DN12001_c0_g1_i1.p1  ORF type:complete len:1192 (+),score=372.92 TRINITY_DN12001_c0_g1_i1:71-3646(+)